MKTIKGNELEFLKILKQIKDAYTAHGILCIPTNDGYEVGELCINFNSEDGLKFDWAEVTEN